MSYESMHVLLQICIFSGFARLIAPTGAKNNFTKILIDNSASMWYNMSYTTWKRGYPQYWNNIIHMTMVPSV